MSAEASSTASDRRHFVLRRLHSLSGIVPVGLFLCIHLWTNSKAIQGQTCFDKAVDDINHLPYLPFVEVFGIFLPLAFHAGYGVKLALEAKPNVGAYGYGRNWLYVLQRITGVIAFVFLVFHLKDFRIAKLLGQMTHHDFFGKPLGLQGQLGGESRLKALFYVLGTSASVFHFANGVRTFLFSWGVTIGTRAQRLAGFATLGLGAALWFMGMNTILFFATGGATFVPSSLVRGENGRDMCEDALVPTASHVPIPGPAAPLPAKNAPKAPVPVPSKAP